MFDLNNNNNFTFTMFWLFFFNAKMSTMCKTVWSGRWQFNIKMTPFCDNIQLRESYCHESFSEQYDSHSDIKSSDELLSKPSSDFPGKEKKAETLNQQ